MPASPGPWAVLLAVLLGTAVAPRGVHPGARSNPSRRGLRRARRISVTGLAVVLVAIMAVGAFQPSPAALGPGPPRSPVRHWRGCSTPCGGSDAIERLPPNLVPPLAQAVLPANLGVPASSTGCSPDITQSTVPACVFGDGTGTHPWCSPAVERGMVATPSPTSPPRPVEAGRAVEGGVPGRPAPGPGAGGEGGGRRAEEMAQLRRVDRINRIDPDLLIVSQSAYDQTPSGGRYTAVDGGGGWTRMLDSVTAPGTQKVVLGDIPSSRHPTASPSTSETRRRARYPAGVVPDALRRSRRARRAHRPARFIDVKPWFCRTSRLGHRRLQRVLPHQPRGGGCHSRMEGVLAERRSISPGSADDRVAVGATGMGPQHHR